MTARSRRRGRRGPAIPLAVDRLTRRQRQVVRAYVTEAGEKGAAHALGIVPATVERHLANARSKIGATTTAQLVYALAWSEALQDFRE